MGFELASVIDSLLDLGQISVLLSQFTNLGLSFPIAELENWPKACEEAERKPMLSG